MNTTQRNTTPFLAASIHHAEQGLSEADIDQHDNIATAKDMLEFMQIAFQTDDHGGMMLSPAAVRGVGEILHHIQSVMSGQH